MKLVPRLRIPKWADTIKQKNPRFERIFNYSTIPDFQTISSTNASSWVSKF